MKLGSIVDCQPGQEEIISASVEMVLFPPLDQRIREFFDIDIEILQGTTENLADGSTRYQFTVCPEKALLIREFIKFVAMKNFNINYN